MYNFKASHKLIKNNLLKNSSALKLNKHNEKELQKIKCKFDIVKLYKAPNKEQIGKSQTLQSVIKKILILLLKMMIVATYKMLIKKRSNKN